MSSPPGEGPLAPVPFTRLRRRLWRLVSPKWMDRPLSGAGAAQRGGRWNPPYMPALYLSEDHATAIAEYNQDLEHPGTLIPFDLDSGRIADLTAAETRVACGVAEADLTAAWKRIASIKGGEPPGWRIARSLADHGAHGARVPSAQVAGANIVLWRWNGRGTLLTVRDPYGDLPSQVMPT